MAMLTSSIPQPDPKPVFQASRVFAQHFRLNLLEISPKIRPILYAVSPTVGLYQASR
jgi:hypothetical protein